MNCSKTQRPETSIRRRPASERSVSAIPPVAREIEAERGLIYLMYVYGKNQASSLTLGQKKQLREIVLHIKGSGDKETRV